MSAFFFFVPCKTCQGLLRPSNSVGSTGNPYPPIFYFCLLPLQPSKKDRLLFFYFTSLQLHPPSSITTFFFVFLAAAAAAAAFIERALSHGNVWNDLDSGGIGSAFRPRHVRRERTDGWSGRRPLQQSIGCKALCRQGVVSPSRNVS